MKLKSTILLLCVLSYFSFSTSDPIEDSLPPIILILDGSGSMWGKIGSKTKISIARGVVVDVLDKMDPLQSVGLVAYGHRYKSDCEDIEILAEPNTHNHDIIKSALHKLNPTGKTPLANTALEVIKNLKENQQSATLILISDGEESCNGDLCKVVKEAKEAGIEFVLHIVGFDLGDADQLSLECAAKEGGGMYINAENGDQLNEALIQTTTLAVEEMEPKLSVKVIKDGNLHDAAVKVSKSGETKHFASLRTYTEEKTNPALFALEPGIYDITADLISTNVKSITQKNIEVNSDEIKEVVIDFTPGKISILSTGNSKLWDSGVNIYRIGETQTSAKGRTYKTEKSNPMIKELTPGFYNVHLSALSLLGNKASQAIEKIEVIAGQTTSIEHNYEYGELLVSATNNGIPSDCVLSVNEGEKFLKGGRTGKSKNSKPKSYLLTPGNYNVQFKPHGIYGANSKINKSNIEVIPENVQNVIHNFETGTALITVTNKGKLWKSVVSIYQGNQLVFSKRCSENSKTNPLKIDLTPGTYTVDIKPIKLDVKKRKAEIIVEKGKVYEELVEF